MIEYLVHQYQSLSDIVNHQSNLFNFILVLGESEVDIHLKSLILTGVVFSVISIPLFFISARFTVWVEYPSELGIDLVTKQVGSLGIIVFYRTIDSSVEESKSSPIFPEVDVSHFKLGLVNSVPGR